MGLASSRAQARQLVTHGHIMVNGHKVDIASYSVRPGDVITVKERSRKSPYFKDLAEDFGRKQTPPKWLSVNTDEMSATVVALPEREDIDITINEQLIVEYYSR
jgi:small subunit ribosomal protein S4